MLCASQAEICYWAPYSLCGTKPMRKVFKSPKTVTHPTGGSRSVVRLPRETCETRILLRSSHGSDPDHSPVTGTRRGPGAAAMFRSATAAHLAWSGPEQTFLRTQQPDEVKHYPQIGH
ncbi:hypothetical protein CP979_14230 [Streptomyces filamentosus]|nr:hypothetical protein CP979_14230 [Streptomyces filamentosus]